MNLCLEYVHLSLRHALVNYPSYDSCFYVSVIPTYLLSLPHYLSLSLIHYRVYGECMSLSLHSRLQFSLLSFAFSYSRAYLVLERGGSCLNSLHNFVISSFSLFHVSISLLFLNHSLSPSHSDIAYPSFGVVDTELARSKSISSQIDEEYEADNEESLEKTRKVPKNLCMLSFFFIFFFFSLFSFPSSLLS